MSIDELDSREDLEKQLRMFRGQLEAAHRRIDDLEALIDEQAETIARLERDVDQTRASVPDQSRTKIENIRATIEHAYDRQTGPSGTKLPSGEVTAVIDGSKQTALRLMDDIAGKFEWAETENPGGPNPKALKIRTNAPLDDRLDELMRRY